MVREKKMIAIHDCFLIDYLDITLIISTANEGMEKIFDLNLKINSKIKIYSIFILV
jgi:hypothetical protein